MSLVKLVKFADMRCGLFFLKRGTEVRTAGAVLLVLAAFAAAVLILTPSDGLLDWRDWQVKCQELGGAVVELDGRTVCKTTPTKDNRP